MEDGTRLPGWRSAIGSLAASREVWSALYKRPLGRSAVSTDQSGSGSSRSAGAAEAEIVILGVGHYARRIDPDHRPDGAFRVVAR